MTIPSEEELLKNACHIGHRVEKWNPRMKPYLYGQKNGVHIFDLVQTKSHLQDVCEKLVELHSQGKVILFVSTKQHSTALLQELGQATGHPTVTKKWIPGLLTNWKTISRRIKYYLDLQQSFKTGEVEKYTKSEQTQLRKKLAKLDNALSGVSGMTGLPDVIFVVDAVRDDVAVREARKSKIPLFGMCDSNADPDMFSGGLVPCNDDAINAVKLILNTVKEALMSAKVQKKDAPAEKSDTKEAAVAA